MKTEINQIFGWPGTGLNSDDSLDAMPVGDSPTTFTSIGRQNVMVPPDNFGKLEDVWGTALVAASDRGLSTKYMGHAVDTNGEWCYYFLTGTTGSIDTHSLIGINLRDAASVRVVMENEPELELDSTIVFKKAAYIDGWVYWASGQYGPKKIHIERAMNFTTYKDLAWQSTESYDTGDKVLYTDGGIYECLNDSVSGTPPPNATSDWSLDSYAYPNTAITGSASLLDGAFDLVELPPITSVTGEYGDDTSRLYNNLRGKMFQFTYRWKYRNGGYSNTAPFSGLFLPPDVESYNGEILNSFATNNVLTLYFDSGNGIEIEYAELFVRMGAELSWQYVDKIDAGTNTYLFYNDYIMEVASDDMVNKLDNYIPRETRALELLSENVLVLGGNKYGFDNVTPDVGLTVQWEPSELFAKAGTADVNYNMTVGIESVDEIGNYSYYYVVEIPDADDAQTGDILSFYIKGTGFIVTKDYIVQADDIISVETWRDRIIAVINEEGAPLIQARYENPPEGVTLSNGDFVIYGGLLDNTTDSYISVYTAGAVTVMNKYPQFKTGAKHVFGITYFDRAMRPFAIAANADTEVYVDTVVDAKLNGDLFSSTEYTWRNSIAWEILHEAPVNAKYWQWFYAGNQNIDDFWFYVIDSASTTDGVLSVVISGLQAVQTQFPMSQAGPYVWAKGDRIRCVTKAAASSAYGALADEQVDLEIKAFNEDTFTMTLQATGTDTYDFGAGSLVEIYRPKTSANDNLFFAFGPIYETYVFSADVYHMGATKDQVGTTVGNGAQGTFQEGDCYLIARAFNVVLDGSDKSDLFLVESKSYSDFYDSDWCTQGKINIRSIFGEEPLKGGRSAYGEVELNNIAISNKLIQDTGINGLCTFEWDDTVTLPDRNGPINALRQIGNVLRVVQQRKRTSFYVGMTEFYNQDGTASLVASSEILGNARELDGDWGTENPETVVQIEDMLFFWDLHNRAFVQDSENGAVAISNNKMRQFFIELGDEIMTAIYLGTDYTLACDYHPLLQTLCFYYYIDGVTPKIMLYHLPSKRWVSPISGLETTTAITSSSIEIPLPTIGNYDTFNAGTPTLFSQGFTLTESKQLSSVLFGVIAKGGAPVYDIRLSVYNSSGGQPTTLIEDSTNVRAASALGAPTFTFNNTSLAAGNYCLVLSYENVVTLNVSDKNSVAITGNGYAGGAMAISSDDGATWTTLSSYDMRMIISFASTTSTSYNVGGLIGAENRFFVVNNGDLHLMSSVADRREFIGKTTKESAYITIVGNAEVLMPKIIDTVGVVSNEKTGWAVDTITIPADQTTMVDQSSKVFSADWLTREGVTRAPVKRNAYTSGVYAYKDLWEGEKMRGRVVKVTFTLPTQTSGKVEVVALEIGMSKSNV